MILNSIFSGSPRSQAVPLECLSDSHRITQGSIAVYRRFYGLDAITLCDDDLFHMLSAVLTRALETVPNASESDGQLIYCKTQTHNTFSDDGWLRSLADKHGLSRWETFSWAMTNCASAIVAMHFLEHSSTYAPVILITGEKAFHPSVSALSVGLLSEIPAASVLNVRADGWRVLATHVQHLGGFYENPDQIKTVERRRLQEIYADAFRTFIDNSLTRYRPMLRGNAVLVPHNLNLPVTKAVIRQLGWEDRMRYGDVAHLGHAYCSDLFLNLDRLTALEGTALPEQVILVAAGTGVTFASCMLERERVS
nr:3-oxoacyl-[acyl-carrier-protein] synthase III C-terminal domain-containing protein [Mesorhizobium loti]